MYNIYKTDHKYNQEINVFNIYFIKTIKREQMKGILNKIRKLKDKEYKMFKQIPIYHLYEYSVE